jgi:hypothetical protein
MQYRDGYLASSLMACYPFGVKIGAERVIPRSRVNALASNENCRTIAFHNCDFVSALINVMKRLPSLKTLDFDGCFGDKQEHDTDLSRVPGSLTWDGDTVTVVNSDLC